MTGITTHVLDTARGCSAGGVGVTLEIEVEGGWKMVGRGTTDADGRQGNLTPRALDAGRYRLTFETWSYQRSAGRESFYPYVIVVFDVADSASHYHVPLLLSPFGYSTYRGS